MEGFYVEEGSALERAMLCSAIECPVTSNASVNLPPGCEIPYGQGVEEYCTSVKMNDLSGLIVLLGTALYLFGVGLDIDFELIKRVAFREPKACLLGIFCQSVVNPLFMLGILAIFRSFPVTLKIAALLIATSPGGGASNVLTLIAGGIVELSVSMTVFSTCIAFATMPFYVWLSTTYFWADEVASLEIDFMSIFTAAVMAVAVPGLGLAIKLCFGKSHKRCITILQKASVLLGIILTVAGVVLYLFDPLLLAGIVDSDWDIWVCALCMNIGGLLFGYVAARICGYGAHIRRTITFETGTQNISITLATIILTYSDGPAIALFLPFVGVYLIMSLLPAYGLAIFWRYCKPVSKHSIDDLDPRLELDEDSEEKEVQALDLGPEAERHHSSTDSRRWHQTLPIASV